MGWTQGPGNFATVRKIDPELAEQWKCAQLPYFDKQMYMAGGSALLIPVGAKSTDAAVRFIKFVMQPETVNFAAKELMYAPFKSPLRSSYAKAASPPVDSSLGRGEKGSGQSTQTRDALQTSVGPAMRNRRRDDCPS